MCELSPAQADALGLLGEDLYVHLNEADSLSTQTAEWSTDDMERARKVIGDLVLVIRALLIEHRLRNGRCRLCVSTWPCPVVSTIHAFLKDPERQFVALVQRSHDDG